MNKFLKLWSDGTLIMTFLAMGAFSVVSYMFVAGQEVPESLLAILTMIIGFYFRGVADKANGAFRASVLKKNDK